MIRTQLYLSEGMHERLQRIATERGTTVSALVRSALDVVYAPAVSDERWRQAIDGAAGAWADRSDVDDEWHRRVRAGHRLDALFAAEDPE